MCKSTNCLLVSLTLAVTILVATFGCGKRITVTSRTDLKSDSLQYNNSVELRQDLKLSDIGSIRPVDVSKPMVINGKYYYNVQIDFDKSVTSGAELKASENLSYKGSEAEAENRNTERKNDGHIYLILSLVLGTLFVLYVTLTKYKILWKL